jgi:hypothetical protein
MTRNIGRLARVGAAVVAGLATAALGAAPAQADAVPFDDPNATSSIGFCDKAGHEITSGKIGDAPFAWTAVATDPAPKGFAAPRGRASLFAYQPIKYVDAGDWSGKQMTAASRYTSTAHPMAQATTLDPALVDFVSAFTPHWDGLVQFRMFFTAPLSPQHTGTYPAAVVKVQGDTWKLISGGHPDCHAGKAVSNETVALPSSVFNGPSVRATPGVKASSPAAGSKGAATGSPAASGSTSGATGANDPASASKAAAEGPAGGSGSRAWWVLLVGALAAAAGAGGWQWRRRRAS